MSKILESKIHNELKNIIEQNNFNKVIKGREAIHYTIKSLKSETFIPSFSLDYLARNMLLKSAEYILPKLNYLDLISSDKSISKEKGEILRPDIVAYNPEQNCFIVVEIKKGNKTARETLTELLAYEHEIQNHVPFCSSLDILFVIVSPEWSTLLEHSITSAVTWSSHKILALNYDVDNGDLSVHIPRAWSRLSMAYLPKDSGSTVTLFCSNLKEDEPLPILRNALNLIKENGDRDNLTGFCYLWRDWHPLSHSSWNITICVINPINIYKESSFMKLNQRSSPLGSYISQNITDMESYYPSSMFSVFEKGKEYLERFCSTSYEGLSSWFLDLEVNRFRSMPYEFKFFGKLSSFSSELIGNEAFWATNNEALLQSHLDFCNPILAVPFINSIFNKGYMSDGIINLYESSKIGVLLSILELSLQNYLSAKEEPFEKKAYFLCIYRWYQYDLITLANEIKFLLMSISSDTSKMPLLRIADDDEALRSIVKFRDWLMNKLLGEHNVMHKNMMLLGYNLGVLTDKTFRDIISEKDCIQMINSQEKEVSYLASFLDDLNEIDVNEDIATEANVLKLKIEQILGKEISKNEALKLVEHTVQKLPKLLDVVVDPVHFNLIGKIDLSSADWTEIRNSYIEHQKRHKGKICVYLQSNGHLGIALHKIDSQLFEQKLPEDSFLFLDQRHAFSLARIVSWSSVDDGSFFEEF